MKAEVLAVLVSLDINCASYTLGEKVSADESWKRSICAQYFSAYRNVKLKAIRNVQQKITKPLNKSEGIVSQPVGGRVILTRAVVSPDGWLEMRTYYKLEAYQDVWLSRSLIGSDKVVSSRDVNKREMNVASYLGINKVLSDSPIGKYTIKRIGKGHIFFSDSVSEIPLIKKGAVLPALITSTGIRLEAKATAMENGFLEGDQIRVRLVSTGKLFTGRIVNSEKIYIEI